MAEACRKVISDWWKSGLPTGENASLLRDRYLQVTVKDKANHPQARRNLFSAMGRSLTQLKTTYLIAYERNKSSLRDPKIIGQFNTVGRLVIGLGGENVLETGITLHHTYGTPLIPGTALKGLASHYCDKVWGARDGGRGFKRDGNYHKAIFGTTDDSGHIIFHDAWIIPETLMDSLQPDVMTPHHGDYYSGKGAPTDFDDPNPVTFLSIVGTFQVAVSCDVAGDEGKKWAELVFGMLSDALRDWGIGGKTNSGYGRLEKSTNEPIAKTTTSKSAPSKNLVDAKVSEPKALRPMYKKGEVVAVIRDEDPNVRRGKPYFRADDGSGGFIQFGNAPSLQIGQKTHLEISGVMKDGYVFAVPGSKENYIRNKGKGGRR
jgi:CRISPR-associated protein Cmr6